MTDPGHVSEEALLRLLDGEIAGAARMRIEQHLESCGVCAARKHALATTSGMLGDMLRVDAEAPTLQSPGLRARVRLGMTASERDALPGWKWSMLGAAIALPLLAVLVGFVMQRQASRIRQTMTLAGLTQPDRTLTPGEVRQIGVAELCSEDAQDFDPEVPAPLQQAVFQEYGMIGSRSSEYQVDYLVSPQLGGTNSLANLWPEPYGAPVWNAHTKDALEQRLRQMVCRGEVDLPSAQQAIRADWIAAYRKYVSADEPR